MSYILSDYGVKFITTEESFASTVHNNDGHPTGGFGHTGFWPDGSPLTVGQTVTKDQAVEWFKTDIRKTLDSLWKAAPGLLSQPEVDSLTSLLFNCGTGVLGLEHTLGQAIAKQDLKAIGDAIILYDMATIHGVRGPFLATRRAAEYDMFNGADEVSTPSGIFECAPAQGDIT